MEFSCKRFIGGIPVKNEEEEGKRHGSIFEPILQV
jgi:hypothetical protein